MTAASDLEALTARTFVFYIDGAPKQPDGPGALDPTRMGALIPPLCRQYGCSLSVVHPYDGEEFTVVHRTGQGHEHTSAFPTALLEDVSVDLWALVTDRVNDVHSSMGMV